MSEKRVFFWIANGNRFSEEASFSAHSVTKFMPDIPRFLFTPFTPSNTQSFTQVVVLTPPAHKLWYMDSMQYMVTALKYLEMREYRYAIYLDTDTCMLNQVPELFELMAYYDFAGVHAPGRKTCTHVNLTLPSSLVPELNIGVNAMFIPTAIGLFEDALDRYWNHSDLYNLDQDDGNDQGPLRDALVDTIINRQDYRFLVLPPEYNCRFNFPCFLNGEVKILHGRNPDLAKIGLDINSRVGMRLWKPCNLIG